MALLISVLFHLRLRLLRKFNPSAMVFDKTFNVFDPYPESRKVLHSFISLLSIFINVGAIVLAGFMLTIVVETGFLLSIIILIVCVNLIVLEEAFEAYKGAGLFIRAIKTNLSFGKGDVDAFHMIKNVIPRLIMYYVSLAVVFLSSPLAMPYIISAVLFSISQFFSISEVFSSSGALTSFAPFIIIFSFAVAVVLAQLIVRKVRRKIVAFG
ncbi:MAG: hypothetical protein QXJ53_02465 [Candidatus Bathyarchaeia archaeon]